MSRTILDTIAEDGGVLVPLLKNTGVTISMVVTSDGRHNGWLAELEDRLAEPVVSVAGGSSFSHKRYSGSLAGLAGIAVDIGSHRLARACIEATEIHATQESYWERVAADTAFTAS